MDFENLVSTYEEVREKIEALEIQKKELAAQILQQMLEKKREVGRYSVRRCERLVIKTPLEVARSLEAIMIKEVVDNEKIKTLVREGFDIEGVSEIHYLQIAALKTVEIA